ncbi:hypothetical protein HMPREF1985_01855 [Mitsuokella sp. oral taxon 131 str. W9106]|nr:hypothetical protein HMPREF1985_01855 [Mitsuokella sp. oral taxon 131 str. W9106]
MRQVGRSSGKWERISWDEAFDIIAKQILSIKEEYGSTLPICLNKYSGNFNLLNYCVEGMMSSIGHTTRATGTPCWPAGIDAQTFDFGTIWNNDPEDLVNSKYLIIWGANPAWCSVHSMYLIEQAQRQGCKVVVIDPTLTQTASKADWYIQIKASTDGALALGMASYILEHDLVDRNWLQQNAKGYEEYFSNICVKTSPLNGRRRRPASRQASSRHWHRNTPRPSPQTSGSDTGCSAIQTAVRTSAASTRSLP